MFVDRPALLFSRVTCLRRLESVLWILSIVPLLMHEFVTLTRFIDCEKWRKEFGTDDLVRTFDYKEKPQVFQYYPQYYHKTDKVSLFFLSCCLIGSLSFMC